MTPDDETVEIPAWVAQEALQEFDLLIKRTGGPDAHDANGPLAEARQRLQTSELSPQATGLVVGTLKEVADERGVELSGADPLTDRTFKARDELDAALEEAFGDDTANVEEDA